MVEILASAASDAVYYVHERVCRSEEAMPRVFVVVEVVGLASMSDCCTTCENGKIRRRLEQASGAGSWHRDRRVRLRLIRLTMQLG
jgi:hypothetical protein